MSVLAIASPFRKTPSDLAKPAFQSSSLISFACGVNQAMSFTPVPWSGRPWNHLRRAKMRCLRRSAIRLRVKLSRDSSKFSQSNGIVEQAQLDPLGQLGEEGEVGAGAVERGAQRISATRLELHLARVWTTLARRDLLSAARSGASPTAGGSFRISGKTESARLSARWTSRGPAESATPIPRTGPTANRPRTRVHGYYPSMIELL